jgi:hypothetical protein
VRHTSQHPQVQHLPDLQVPRLDEHPDVLSHALAIEEGHGFLASFGAGAPEIFENAAGGEPEGLAGEGHRRQPRRLACLPQSREVHTGGEILLSNRGPGGVKEGGASPAREVDDSPETG